MRRAGKLGHMRWLLAASLLSLAAGQDFPQGVELVQRLDQAYRWLHVMAFDADAQGNTYLAGYVQGAVPSSVNVRVGPLGALDFVVLKLDSSGRQIYGAAIGGTKEELAGGIKVDTGGNLYLFGTTSSADYPAVSSQPAASNATVVLKLDPTGNVIYDRHLDWVSAILTMGVDAAGDLYIGGIHQPGGFPVSAGFIARLDPTGTLASVTAFGEQVSNLAIRANGDILYSMGKTIGALDGSLSHSLFSTLTDIDTNIGNLGVDSAGNVYVAVPDAVRKYAPDGVRLLWRRDFTAGSFPGFVVTASGTAILFGKVPPNYPTLNGTQPCWSNLLIPISNGLALGSLMVIDPDGQLLYATFMAEDIAFNRGTSISATNGRPYAFAVGFLPAGPNNQWEGILRLDPNDLPEAHTFAGCLVHSGTLKPSPVAPGTIMTLFGEQIGPGTGASFALQDGHAPFDIGGASITVDGKPAPVLYAQAGQINFIAPWSLRTDGTRVPICVQMNTASSCLYAATALVSPGLFTVNGSIAAINPDGTINSPEHPAPSGSYISVYLSGGGQIQGPMVDGGVAGNDLQRIVAADAAVFTGYQCGFFGCFPQTQDAQILFDGAAPSLIYGVNAVVVQVPSFNFTLGRGGAQAAQGAQFTFSLRPIPQGTVLTASGVLFIR